MVSFYSNNVSSRKVNADIVLTIPLPLTYTEMKGTIRSVSRRVLALPAAPSCIWLHNTRMVQHV